MRLNLLAIGLSSFVLANCAGLKLRSYVPFQDYHHVYMHSNKLWCSYTELSKSKKVCKTPTEIAKEWGSNALIINRRALDEKFASYSK